MMQWGKLFGHNGQSHLERNRIVEEARRLLPDHCSDVIPSAIDPVEVTKVALRLKYLIEECIPCELGEELVTKPHSRIVTPMVLKAAKEAVGEEYSACVVYCLLVNLRWFKRQAKFEIWHADLHNLRAVAAETIAKRIIEEEERIDYLMQSVLLTRYATIVDGKPTNVANAVETSVDLHALRVIGSSGYQKTVQYLWKGWLVQSDKDPTRFINYKEKANTHYFVHVQPDRMRAPVYQNAVQVIFSLIYLGLYTRVINTVNPTGDLDIAEGLLYVFTFGFACDEFSKLWKVGRNHIGFWNIFNLVLYSLLATSLILRFVALGHPLNNNDGQREKYNTLSYNFLALSAPMFWMRLLLFLDTVQFFGSMLVVVQVMMRESLIFFALLTVVFAGFLQAFIGLGNADNHTDATVFILQAMAYTVMKSPNFSGFDAFAQPFGTILYYIFTFVVTVILLNILIALYNSAYRDIIENSLYEYMALFARKTMQYVRAPDQNVFIAPFNLIEIFCLIIPFEWWMPTHLYARLNDYVMAFLYSPLLLVAALFETRSAREVNMNRRRGELDDDRVEEWEQMRDAVNFESEGWAEKVQAAKSNVEDDQATLEVRQLRRELKEMQDMLHTLFNESKGKDRAENGSS